MGFNNIITSDTEPYNFQLNAPINIDTKENSLIILLFHIILIILIIIITSYLLKWLTFRSARIKLRC